MAREGKCDKLALFEYDDVAEKAMVEKIIEETMAGLSDDLDDNEEFDFEEMSVIPKIAPRSQAMSPLVNLLG